MLILARKDCGQIPGSSFTLFNVHDRTVISLVKVVRIDRDTVKLGFCAPGHVLVVREELAAGWKRQPNTEPARGMLVISRRYNESVLLAIEEAKSRPSLVIIAIVKIVRIEGNQTKIGIDADREKVGIVRDDAEIDRRKWIALHPDMPPREELVLKNSLTPSEQSHTPPTTVT